MLSNKESIIHILKNEKFVSLFKEIYDKHSEFHTKEMNELFRYIHNLTFSNEEILEEMMKLDIPIPKPEFEEVIKTQTQDETIVNNNIIKPGELKKKLPPCKLLDSMLIKNMEAGVDNLEVAEINTDNYKFITVNINMPEDIAMRYCKAFGVEVFIKNFIQSKTYVESTGQKAYFNPISLNESHNLNTTVDCLTKHMDILCLEFSDDEIIAYDLEPEVILHGNYLRPNNNKTSNMFKATYPTGFKVVNTKNGKNGKNGSTLRIVNEEFDNGEFLFPYIKLFKEYKEFTGFEEGAKSLDLSPLPTKITNAAEKVYWFSYYALVIKKLTPGEVFGAVRAKEIITPCVVSK